MTGEIEVSRDRFRCVFVVFLYVTKVFLGLVACSRLPLSPIWITFLERVEVMLKATLAEVQVKWTVTLMDRLGPDIFSTLWMKGHVLLRARAHIKVPGWSIQFGMHLWLKMLRNVNVPNLPFTNWHCWQPCFYVSNLLKIHQVQTKNYSARRRNCGLCIWACLVKTFVAIFVPLFLGHIRFKRCYHKISENVLPQFQTFQILFKILCRESCSILFSVFGNASRNIFSLI